MNYEQWLKENRPKDLDLNIKNTFWKDRSNEYFSISMLHRTMGYLDDAEKSLVPDDIRQRVRRFGREYGCRYENTFAPTIDEKFIYIEDLLQYLKDGKIKWQDLPNEFILDLQNNGAKWRDESDSTKKWAREELQKIGKWKEQVQLSTQ